MLQYGVFVSLDLRNLKLDEPIRFRSRLNGKRVRLPRDTLMKSLRCSRSLI